MKYARKKPKIVTAYQLGAGTPMEEALIREGAIQRLAGGGYALFPQVERDRHDGVTDVVFSFVARRDFERDYVLLDIQ